MLFVEKYYKGVDLPRVVERLHLAAKNIGCDVYDLDTCIFLESTWNPQAYNSASGAWGLIQWLDSTAKDVAKVVSAKYIGQQSAYIQLAYVEQYFLEMKRRLKLNGFATKYDLYLTIFYPAAVGKPETFVLLESAQKGYSGNKGLDYNKDGRITKSEVMQWFDSAVKKKALLKL